MKTNPTTIILNIRRSLRNWTMVAFLLPLLSVTSLVRAQVTNVIYQDSFARTGLLNGSMPDTDATGAKYIAGPLVFTGSWTDQNGNTENACLFSNNIPAVLGPLYNDAFLPIPGGVETGHIYTLTASILANTNYGANWMYLAFDTSPSLQAVQGNWYAGMLLRSTNNPAGNGNAQNFAAAGTGTGATFNWTPSGTPWHPQYITVSIVLNLTNAAAMTETWYTNGVQIRTFNIGANITGANNGMWPRYIAFGQSGCSGYFTNLSLTDVVPFPSAPTIPEPPNNLTAAQGQTATFWVNAVGTPDPTYQWMMTNNGSGWVNITGATNATYTTPALSSSYNGLQYQVQVTNVAGSVTSSVATLTVTSGNPTVYSAMKTASLNNIVVNFSGPVDPVTSQNAANYTLNNGASVVSVSAGSVPSSVVLTTSALNPAAAYNLTVQNVQDLFGDAMAVASTSAVLPAGLVLDLKGDSGVQVDASGNVAQWLDQTTNGNNASDFFGWRQSTSGLSLPGNTTRPAPGTTINGLQTVTFNKANNTFLQVASSPSIAINTNITIYCVSMSDLSVPQATMISKDIGNQPGSFEFDVAQSGGLVEPYFGGGAAGNGAAAFAAGAVGVGNIASAHVFMATRTFIAAYTNAWTAGVSFPAAQTNWFYTSSNSLSLYLDAIQTLANAANNIPAPGAWDGGEPVYIGEREDHFGNTRMNGQIAEILVFNTALSAADRTNVDNYLGVKWFTPFFATPPPNPLITSNGFAVTMSPSPSYGSIHGVTMQWQENGTNLPGATNASYTTPILAPSDDNDTFSLIMSIGYSGLTYTNTTTLTVLTNAPYIAWAGIPVWNTTNQVVVLFDEAVDPVTATAATNYSLNNGVSVLSAAFGNALNQVVLTTTPITWNAIPGTYTLSVSNVMDLYGFTMVGASLPLGLYPPNVVLWLKATTGVLTDAGTNTVFEWDDQSGNGNNFIQPAGLAFEPHLATNVWGDVVLRFTNTPAVGSNYMYNNGSSTLGITGDMSLFAAVNFQPQTGRNGSLLSKDGLLTGTKNIASPYDIYMGTAGPLFNRGNGGTGGNGTSYGLTTGTLAPPAYGYPCVVEVSESGNTVSQYLDNKAAGTGLLSNGYQEANDFDSGNLTFIGYRADGFNSLTADLAEMIVTTSSSSSADVAALGNYLSTQHHFVLFNPNATKIVLSFNTNLMTLSWPADHTGWQLQSNSVGLTATGAWYSVSGSTLTNQITVMPAAGSSNVFYRMFYQQP